MAMPVMVPRYTVDDLDSFPDDGNRYELLDGVLLVSPAPMPPHEFVVIRIRDQLISYLGSVASVLTSGAVQVKPKNHLEPDLLVMPASVSVARDWSKIRGFWLAVEVSGRGSRIYDRDFKQAAYLALGVAEAWRVDLRDHSIDVSVPGSAGVTTFRDQLTWWPPGFDTEFSLDIPAVFAGIEDDD
ncbi:MAG: Uma2 family endonuclease [Gemmatimonadales bacterium]